MKTEIKSIEDVNQNLDWRDVTYDHKEFRRAASPELAKQIDEKAPSIAEAIWRDEGDKLRGSLNRAATYARKQYSRRTIFS